MSGLADSELLEPSETLAPSSSDAVVPPPPPPPPPVRPGITTKPILQYLKDRVRQSYVDEALWTDADVLSVFNDAYQDVCEQSQCLQVLLAIPVTADTAEYALPDDFDQLITIVANGSQMAPIALSESLLDNSVFGYYLYGKPGSMTFGVSPTPQQGSSDQVMILYSASPTLFVSLDDDFDERFPVEYSDLLVHYARWRVQMMSGGAERIQNASTDRAIYDKRLIALRRTATTVGSNIAPGHFVHVSDTRRITNAR